MMGSNNGNRSRNKSNPWTRAPTGIDLSGSSVLADADAFPSVGDIKKEAVVTPQKKKESKSLPLTSSWGKNVGVRNHTETKEEEGFPSLSKALKIPRAHVPAARIKNPKVSSEKISGSTKIKPPAPVSSKTSTVTKLSAPSSTSSSAKTKTASVLSKASTATKLSIPSHKSQARANDVGIIGRHDTTGLAKKTGKQRLAPQKKKLTTLKKHVLRERLRVWNKQNRIKPTGSALTPNSAQLKATEESATLVVKNIIHPSEDYLSDSEEYNEILSDLISLLKKVGTVVDVFVPCDVDAENAHYIGLAFVRYATAHAACAARDMLNGLVVAGCKILVSILGGEDIIQYNNTEVQDCLWRQSAMRVLGDMEKEMSKKSSRDHDTTVIFHDILCQDEFEDSDALQESICGAEILAQQYGAVIGTRVARSANDKGNIYISLDVHDCAVDAVQQLNDVVVGGNRIAVSIARNLYFMWGLQETLEAGHLVLPNILNEDDYEDEECFNESMRDIQIFAKNYGNAGDVKAEISGEQKGWVHIKYTDGYDAAVKASRRSNEWVVGGVQLSAFFGDCCNSTTVAMCNEFSEGPPLESGPDQPPPPMYSGDKIIPEQFAACKRVPKIPNSGTPRAYATRISDERATPTLIKMLGELMRLQDRSKDDKNARARRRLVMGLREVARGIRAHKVKMVIMANNLDTCGAIDSKLQEILDLASMEDVPVIFELNKRKLGKALGKSIKIAVVGVQSADGAHQEYKALKKMMGVV